MIGEISREMQSIIAEGWTDGIVIEIGKHDRYEAIIAGISNGSQMQLSEQTIYDLASVTKIFTLAVTMNLHEQGLLNIEDCIGSYTKVFPDLVNIKIFELMNFSVQLETERRIEHRMPHDKALNEVYNIKVAAHEIKYSDMGSIVLSELINIILGDQNGFRTCVCDMIRNCNMSSTFWWDDIAQRRTDLMSYDHEYKYLNGEMHDIRTRLGDVHDRKARSLICAGHAGLVSSPEDMRKFAIALLNGEVLSKGSINSICSNQYNTSGSGQTFGLLCYKKNPCSRLSEIPDVMSEDAIAISGYTGVYFGIDFDNKIYVILCGNRVANRLTYTDDRSAIQHGYYDMGERQVKYTADYVYRRDKLKDMCMKYLLNERYQHG